MRRNFFILTAVIVLLSVPTAYAQAVEPKEKHINYEETSFYDMAYNGERYVAVGSKALLVTSTDLKIWQPVTGLVDISETISKVKWDGDEFIAYTCESREAYPSGSIEAKHVLHSKDGLTWMKAYESPEICIGSDTKIAETDAGDMKYSFSKYDQKSPEMFFRKKGTDERVQVMNDFENPLDYLYFKGRHYVYTRSPFCVNVSEDLVHWETKEIEVENASFGIKFDSEERPVGGNYVSANDKVKFLIMDDSIDIICISEDVTITDQEGVGALDSYLIASSHDGVYFEDTGARIESDTFRDNKFFSFTGSDNEKIIAGLAPYKITFSKNYGPFQEAPVNQDRLAQIEKINAFPAIAVTDFWNGKEYMTFESLRDGFFAISKDNPEWEKVYISEATIKALDDKGFLFSPVYYPPGLKAVGDHYMFYNTGHGARGMSETEHVKSWFLLDRKFNLIAYHRFDQNITDIAYADGKYIVWLYDRGSGVSSIQCSSNGEDWVKSEQDYQPERENYIIHGLLYKYFDTQSGNAFFSKDQENWLEIVDTKVYSSTYEFYMKTEYSDYVTARSVYAIGDNLYIRGRDYVYVYSVDSIIKAIGAGQANLRPPDVSYLQHNG